MVDDMSRRKVLLTGFPAFGGMSNNISEDVIKELSSIGRSKVPLRKRPRVDDSGNTLSSDMPIVEIEWQTELLTCDEAGSSRVANSLENIDVDAILHLGLCTSCITPRIETQARNILEMRIADNSGRKISGSEIIINGHQIIQSSSPLNRFPNDSFSTKLEQSDDAGSFVCNETYYRTLSSIDYNNEEDNFGRKLPCLFLHLPDYGKMEIIEAVKLVEEIGAWLCEKPRIVVACSVLEGQDGRFISCRRSPEESFPGMWEFAGGKVEEGESIPEALIREIDEELGVEIEVEGALAKYVHEMPHLEIELHAWHCKIISGQPRLIVHDKLRWLKVEDFLDEEWIAADLPMISKIQKLLLNRTIP
jgi:8-oxo-dGTP diphosphatase